MQPVQVGLVSRRCVVEGRERRQTHGLVIGGGLTGLLAARVLARHLDRVTLLDRDPLPRLPELASGARPAVYPHVHVARGLGSLETLLPGLTAELVTSGAALLDPARDVAWLSAAPLSGACAPLAAPQAGAPRGALPMLTCTRELIEWHARRRVSMLPGVHLLEGVEAVGLETDGTPRRVTGVRVRACRGALQGLRDTLFPADFIVDASGGHGRQPWAATQAQLQPYDPHKTRGMGEWVASTTFRVDHASRAGGACAGADAGAGGGAYRAIEVRAPGARHASGLLLPIERGRMMVTLRGRTCAVGDALAGDTLAPPTDGVSFRRWAETLDAPQFVAALPRADLFGPIIIRHDSADDAPRATTHALGEDDVARASAWPGRFVALGRTSRWPDLGDAAGTMILGMAIHSLDRLLAARDIANEHDSLVAVSRAFQRALARH